jgi:sorting nexin-8
MLKDLLPPGEVPESYVEAFDAVLGEDSGATNGRISTAGVTRTMAAAKLAADEQARIAGLVSPTEGGLGRGEFNVLLALIGLAQEGEMVSLDSVDERRRGKLIPSPRLIAYLASQSKCLGSSELQEVGLQAME